jgi:hypothetical protein
MLLRSLELKLFPIPCWNVICLHATTKPRSFNSRNWDKMVVILVTCVYQALRTWAIFILGKISFNTCYMTLCCNKYTIIFYPIIQMNIADSIDNSYPPYELLALWWIVTKCESRFAWLQDCDCQYIFFVPTPQVLQFELFTLESNEQPKSRHSRW